MKGSGKLSASTKTLTYGNDVKHTVVDDDCGWLSLLISPASVRSVQATSERDHFMLKLDFRISAMKSLFHVPSTVFDSLLWPNQVIFKVPVCNFHNIMPQ